MEFLVLVVGKIYMMCEFCVDCTFFLDSQQFVSDGNDWFFKFQSFCSVSC